MKKIVIALFSLIFIASLAYHFFYRNSVKNESDTLKSNQILKKEFVFGLCTGFGGLGDKAFNDMEYRGMIEAMKQYKVKFYYAEPIVEKDLKKEFMTLINKGCNVIIAGEGYHSIEIIDDLAVNYPNIYFIILDSKAKEYHKNVASISFKQNEGSFLVGALAALMSKTNSIGVIGGDRLEVIDDFFIGYESGAKYIHKNTKVIKKYITDVNKDKSPWANPEVAGDLSIKMIKNDKVDIIFGIAAASNLGIFNVINKMDKFAIGVDANQDYLVPGKILTSMMKRLDNSILFIVENIINHNLKNKPYILGLKEQGISLTPMNYTKNVIPDEILKKISSIKNAIINEEIIVPTVFNK